MSAIQIAASEYPSFYATYVGKVAHRDLAEGLEQGLNQTLAMLESIPDNKLEYRYAEGKWSIKDILQHLMDAERVFAYRLMRISRGDETPLPGFEENAYAAASQADRRSRADLISEYKSIRESTVQLVNSLDDAMLKQIGSVNGGPMSARALGYIIIGHEKHHCEVIQERYL